MVGVVLEKKRPRFDLAWGTLVSLLGIQIFHVAILQVLQQFPAMIVDNQHPCLASTKLQAKRICCLTTRIEPSHRQSEV